MRQAKVLVTILTSASDSSENICVEGYVPIAADKSHVRIIWDCAWSPEGDIFVTASRDKTVSLFQL